MTVFDLHFWKKKQTAGKQVGEIVKLWPGLGNELFTNAHKFEVRFPKGSDGGTKARLLGATFLINQLFFERDDKKGGEN